MFRLIALAAATLSVAACATPYAAVPYEADTAGVETITLIEDVGSAKVLAYEVASVGSNFGLVGALIDAGVQSSRRARVEEALTAAEFDAQDYFRTELTTALETLGYDVETIQLGERERLELLETYPANDDVEAYLDVVLRSYGVLSSGAGTPFRPHSSAEAQLYRPGDGSILMRNTVHFNTIGTPTGQIVLTGDAADAFRNREDLLDDTDELLTAIKDAISQTAQTIAGLMAP